MNNFGAFVLGVCSTVTVLAVLGRIAKEKEESKSIDTLMQRIDALEKKGS